MRQQQQQHSEQEPIEQQEFDNQYALMTDYNRHEGIIRAEQKVNNINALIDVSNQLIDKQYDPLGKQNDKYYINFVIFFMIFIFINIFMNI